MFLINSYINPTLLNFFYGLVSLFFVNYFIKFAQRVRKLPPGPWGLPFVGYLPFIREDAYIHMTELAAKYGPVFSFKCGKFDLIVINQWKFIKEALKDEHLLGRPKATIIPGIIEHPSLVEMSGEHWKQHRRTALTTLRDVGLGKSEMEDSIRDEIKSFIEVIKSSDGKPISISDKLSLSISNNISKLVFGHRYAYDHPVALDIENLFIKLNVLFRYFNVATFLPFTANLLIKLNLFDMAETFTLFKRFESHIYNEVDEHRKKFDDNELNDYIDGFLKEMTKKQNENDWITIGLNRQPENVDRQQMPFTMAYIYEVFRFSSIVPLNLLRRATEDTKVGDYIIPKDSFVAFNFWSVHHDPNLWDNPQVFKPERFLNEDKSQAIKPPYLIAFSGGKRVCPGESFAYLQFFLYLVSILQQFEISAEPGKDISLERAFYFIIRQKSFPNLIFKSVD